MHGTSMTMTGVEGRTTSLFGFGVQGVNTADNGIGVQGESTNTGTGVRGFGGAGVSGIGEGETGIGVMGFARNAEGHAGYFDGKVHITGTLSKGGGSFKIDHPVDPANKYLSHSFVESPDMMNIYNGIAKLDSNGEVVVKLPEWFEALNKDFRYLLTAVGAPMPGLYIAEEVSNNHFKIAGGAPGLKVSWQVTGIRQDAWANKHRIQVEQDKPEKERGHYLHPEVYDQPAEKSVEWVRNPELMKRMKEMKEETKKRQSATNQ